MNKRKNLHLSTLLKISVLLSMLITGGLIAQDMNEIEWIAIGDLQSWYSMSGSEIEVGRTYLTNSQQDGLQWPAQFENQDNSAAKAIWIGCTNYNDPIAGRPYSYKVVHVGPRVKDDNNEFIPQEFSMVGKFEHPLVTVDGLGATELEYDETVREVDPDLVADRMLKNVVNTGMGITMTRKIYAWGQQYHSNYFIYEYVFKNTGIYDGAGSTHSLTLTDVLFHWQYRYAVAKESCAYGGFWLPQSATWGANTMNDQTNPDALPREAVGYLPARPDTPLRTLFSWCGRHSGWSTTLSNSGTNIGGPEHDGNGHLGASQFVGTVVLYADDPNNIGVDSPDQPFSTEIIGSDVPATKGNNQFNESKMTSEYIDYMDQEWPPLIQADGVGQNTADGYGNDAGGSSQTHTFGKYTLAPGDSVKIVIAEAVAGINRDSMYTVGERWLDWATGGSGPYTLPNGSTTSDGDVYKNAWVFTGVDSLFQTFNRAKDNYDNYFSQGLSIPSPPPPPFEFQVNTGGDRVVLTWASNAEDTPNFAGYNIYRAKFQPDTTYELIKTINGKGVNIYSDLSPQRGFDYYYYITSFDDGSVDPGHVLESSKFYTMTSEPAFLKRPAGTKLADIRIVPNPYNIKAREIQFGATGAGADRIMFYNIPKVCRIKIFTERGDLVNTLEHIDGSGDQEWRQLTSARQKVVSGLYIAHIEVMEDQYDDDTNQLVLKKGDSIIKKFVIIR